LDPSFDLLLSALSHFIGCFHSKREDDEKEVPEKNLKFLIEKLITEK